MQIAEAQQRNPHRGVAPAVVRAHRSPVARLAGAALILATVAVIAACAPAPPGFAPGAAPRVIVYGDSLISESHAEIERRLGQELDGWDVVVRHLGGTAQCDWHGHMRSDVSLRPAVVVLAFSGNRLSQCTQRPYPQLYADDATWATTFWRSHGARVAFVGAPPAVGSSSTPVADRYRSVAAQLGVPFESASPLFVDPVSGLAAAKLPCLPTETTGMGCIGGLVTVRNADGAHLCGTVDCRPYASGVVRYADVVVAAAGRAASVTTTRLPAPTAPSTTAPPRTEPSPTTEPPVSVPPTSVPGDGAGDDTPAP